MAFQQKNQIQIRDQKINSCSFEKMSLPVLNYSDDV